MKARPRPAEGGDAPRLEVLRHVLVAVFSLGLVSLAFHPADLWPLGWCGLAPWMAWHRLRRRRGTARALMAGYYLHFAYVLWWVNEVAPPLVWLIPLLGLPFVALLAFLLDASIHRLRVPALVAYPLAIVSVELLRDQALLGLTWSSIGYTQWRWIEGLQWASVFRVHGVSLPVLAANAGLAAAFVAWRAAPPGARRLRPVLEPLAAAALVVALFHAGGWIALARADLAEGPFAVGIQPNVPQYEKLAYRFHKARSRIAEVYLEAGGPALEPELLVVPETSVGTVVEGRQSLARLLREPTSIGFTLAELLPAGPGRATVLGHTLKRPIPPGSDIPDEDEDGLQEWNVAAVLGGGGEVLGVYPKRAAVPFGETVPLPRGFPGRARFVAAIEEAAGYIPDLTPGEGPLVVAMGAGDRRFRFGPTICYEAVFPRYFRELAREGADFVVNISNDGWYRRSSELDLVQVAITFRAVEVGRSVFRVSNTGISALVDPQGRTRAMVRKGKERKAIDGVLAARIPIGRGTTPWARWGDALGLAFPALGLAAALAARRRRRPPPAPALLAAAPSRGRRRGFS